MVINKLYYIRFILDIYVLLTMSELFLQFNKQSVTVKMRYSPSSSERTEERRFLRLDGEWTNRDGLLIYFSSFYIIKNSFCSFSRIPNSF